MKLLKYQTILKSFLSLIQNDFEDQVSNPTNYISIFFLYCQPFSYLFKINNKYIEDKKLFVLNKIYFYLNSINILQYIRIDTISNIFLWIFCLVLFFLFSVFSLNIVLNYFKLINLSENILIKTGNYICRRIIYFFNVILLIQFLEIFSNYNDCEWYSYWENCQRNSVNILIFSIVGSFFTILFSFLFLWLKNSHLFLDNYILNFKFNLHVFLIYLCRIVLVCFWSLFKNMEIITFFLINMIGIISLLDYFSNFQISNAKFNRFYLCILMNFEFLSLLYTLNYYSNFFSEIDLFYINFVIILIATKIGLFIFKKNELKKNANNFNEIDSLIISLENFYSMFLNEFKQNDQFYIFGILKTHLKNCKEKNCSLNQAKINFYKKMEFHEKEKLINSFISEIFLTNLKKLKLKDENLDFIILKYCSFLLKYNKNSVRVFYEIQHVLLIKQDRSISFHYTIVNLLNNLKKKLLRSEEKSQQNYQNNDKEISLRDYFKILKEKNNLKKELAIILNKKIFFFEKYKEGILSYEKMIRNINNLVDPIRKFKNKLENRLKIKVENYEMIFLLKFKIMLNCFVLNNMNESLKIEAEFEKIKKKEITSNNEILNFKTFFNDNLATLKMSYLNNQGTIIESSKTYKFAKFFNYDLEDLKSINHIKILMPSIISENHDLFIDNYIYTERIEIEKNHFWNTFALNKKGFIFPIKIYIGHSFDYIYDFVFHAAFIDIGHRNEKIVLFDIYGQIQGLTKELFNIFFKNNTKFLSKDIKILNLFPIILDLESLIENNNIFTANHDNNFIINQTSIMKLPKNLDEILNSLILKTKQMEENSNKNKQSKGKNCSNTSNNSKNEIPQDLKTNNFFSNFFRSGKTIKSNNIEIKKKPSKNSIFVKETLADIIKKNEKIDKYELNITIKRQSHKLANENYLKLGILTINSIKKCEEDLNISNKSEENQINILPSEISGLNLPILNSPFENYLSEISGINLPPVNHPFKSVSEIQFRKESDDHLMNNNILNLNNNDDNRLFTTENNITDNIIDINSNNKIYNFIQNNFNINHKKNNSVKLNEKKQSSSCDKIRNFNENNSSQNNTSSNQNKKSFTIFNIIKMIQKINPSQIKILSITQFLQIIMVIIFFISIYILSNEYVTKYHRPLQSATSNLANLYNYYTMTTIITTRAEYGLKGFLESTIVSPVYNRISLEIFNVSYYGMKEVIEIEEKNNNPFDYLQFMKTEYMEVTDLNSNIIRNATIFMFLNQIIQLEYLLINRDLFSLNIISLEYFQVNFMNFNEYFNKLTDKLNSQFYSSSNGIVNTIQTIMISLLIVFLFICLIQIYYIKEFSARLVRLLNIFMRVNNNEVISEILITKTMIDQLNNANEEYINYNCTEKVMTNNRIILQEKNDNNSIIRNYKSSKKKSKVNNFSYNRSNKISNFYNILFNLFIFCLVFGFIFFNYYYLTITHAQIKNVIDLGIIFGKLSAAPSNSIGLNRICLREKLMDNTLYQFEKTYEREKLIYDTLIKNIDELLYLSSEIPNFSANIETSNSKLLKTIIYGNENTSICNELFLINNLNEEQASLCRTNLNGAFTKSLMSVLNELASSLKAELNECLPIDFNNKIERKIQKDNVFKMVKSSSGLTRVLTQYLLLKTIFILDNEMENYYTSLMDQNINLLKTIVFITTIFIMIFFVCCFLIARYFLNYFFKNVAMILNFIPYEKISNDEQTNFLIKNFWRE